MDFLPSDIARLILAYLEKENYVDTFSKFLEECTHLSEIRNMLSKNPARKIATGLMGLSLLDLLKEYSQCKTLVQSYFLDNDIELRPTDSLVSLLEKILSSKCRDVEKGLGEAFAQAVSEAVSDTTGPDPSPQKQSSAPVPFSKAKILHTKVLPVMRGSVVKRVGPRQLRAVINEHKLKQNGTKKSFMKRRVKPASGLDVSVFYDHLLQNRTLHEKIADNINKAMQIEVPKASTTEPVITDVIQTAIQQTESDPVFGNFLSELLTGFDTSTCTDMSVVSIQEQGSDETKATESTSDNLNTPPCETVTEIEPIQASHPVTFNVSADKLSELSIVCSAAESSTLVPSVAAVNTSQITQHMTFQTQELPDLMALNQATQFQQLTNLTLNALQNQSLVILQPALPCGMVSAAPQLTVVSEPKKPVEQVQNDSLPTVKKNVPELTRKRSRMSSVQNTVRKYVNIAPKVTPNVPSVNFAKDDDLLPAAAVATAFHSNIWMVGANAHISFDPKDLLSPAAAPDVREQSASAEATVTPVSMPLLEVSPNIKRLVELSSVAAASLPGPPIQSTPDGPNAAASVKTPRSHVRALAFSPEKPVTPEVTTSENQNDQDQSSAKPVVAKKSAVTRKPWDSQLRDSLMCTIPTSLQVSSKESEKTPETEPTPVPEPKRIRTSVKRSPKKTPKKNSRAATEPPILDPIAVIPIPRTSSHGESAEKAPELEAAVAPAPRKKRASVRKSPKKMPKKSSRVAAALAFLNSVEAGPVNSEETSEPEPVPEPKQIHDAAKSFPKKTPEKISKATAEASYVDLKAVNLAPTASFYGTALNFANEVSSVLLSPVEQASVQHPGQEIFVMERFIAATPVKASDNCSNSTWMIPRTPEIRVHASNSMSPSLVSLTKGFQFLQPTVSPDRITTPDIVGMGPTPSTPNTPIFPRESPHFLTPRVRSLQQEETSQLGTCDISPTQMVFRSSAYFVPSTDSEKKRRRNHASAKAVTPEQNLTASGARKILGESLSADKLICVSRNLPLVDKNFVGKNTVRKLYEDEAASKDSKGVNALHTETHVPAASVFGGLAPIALETAGISAKAELSEPSFAFEEDQIEAEKCVDDMSDVTEENMSLEENCEAKLREQVKPSYVTLRKMPAMWESEIKKKGCVDLQLGYFSESSCASGGESIWSPSESYISGELNSQTGRPLRQSRRSSERASTVSPVHPKRSLKKREKAVTTKSRGKRLVERGMDGPKCVTRRGRKAKLAPKLAKDVENVIQEHLQQARSQIGLRKSPRNACNTRKKYDDQTVEKVICDGFGEQVGTVDQAFIASVQKKLCVQSAVFLTLNIPPS